MPTNLSRYTVAFSDLAWESVNVQKEEIRTSSVKLKPVPMFPKAWMVGRYLQAYTRKNIPEGVIRLGRTVWSAEKTHRNGGEMWKIRWHDDRSGQGPTMQTASDFGTVDESDTDFFDYLIVASGFFSSPTPLNLDVLPEDEEDSESGFDSDSEPDPNSESSSESDEDALMQDADGTAGQASTASHHALPLKNPEFPGKIVHSSEFRSIDDLIPEKARQKGGNIVIVGGGMSGAEAAASVAFQISSANYSLRSNHEFRNFKIHHIASRPFYALAPMLLRCGQQTSDVSPLAPTFLPLDLTMYDYSRRSDNRETGFSVARSGLVDRAQAKGKHTYLRSLIGNDGCSSILYHRDASKNSDRPPYVAISETYSEFVRSGAILPRKGSVFDINGPLTRDAATGKIGGIVRSAPRRKPAKERVIRNVVAIIHATGFTPHTAIDWLSEDVRSTMRCNKTSRRLPLLLQRGCVFHRDVPGIGFVGFYEGPFWGVMEMQARTIARTWANAQTGATNPTMTGTQEQSAKEIQEMDVLRDALMEPANDVPQYWMGDYVGLMDESAQALGLIRDESCYEDGSGNELPLVAARFTDDGCNKREVTKILWSLTRTINAADDGRFVARAAFRAIQGHWNIEHTFTSTVADLPSGTFAGTASFHPRFPTHSKYDAEYLYIENIISATEEGALVPPCKRLIFRYREATDKLSIWLVDGKDDLSPEDLLFDLKFEPPTNFFVNGIDDDGRQRGWMAKGDNTGGEEKCNAICEFRFRGIGLRSFGIHYDVEGPEDQYTSATRYQRGTDCDV
ncbi:hypothetical protein B0A49_00666 [Cryomyces minteri]|uniref:DUF6314 domain-containing protein n=1 Tax=Cryomyces minteri TaxID=331657 RepID=A0A4U0XY78_9PEZI|nr:hypothetical protein B0A49_00666 [Cryomyces minteri]